MLYNCVSPPVPNTRPNCRRVLPLQSDTVAQVDLLHAGAEQAAAVACMREAVAGQMVQLTESIAALQGQVAALAGLVVRPRRVEHPFEASNPEIASSSRALQVPPVTDAALFASSTTVSPSHPPPLAYLVLLYLCPFFDLHPLCSASV